MLWSDRITREMPPVSRVTSPRTAARSYASCDRSVLREFGIELPAEARIRVWDSTSEVRYLVVPQRPAGTEGMGEEALAGLVTRDSMIGTGLARSPGA